MQDEGEERRDRAWQRRTLQVKAHPNQQRLVEAVRSHDMVFAIGPAGTGKTYTAVALAVKARKERQVRRIIIHAAPPWEAKPRLPARRPAREARTPTCSPLYDALKDAIPAARLAEHLETGVMDRPAGLHARPHAGPRLRDPGRGANATLAQLKMFSPAWGAPPSS